MTEDELLEHDKQTALATFTARELHILADYYAGQSRFYRASGDQVRGDFYENEANETRDAAIKAR